MDRCKQKYGLPGQAIHAAEQHLWNRGASDDGLLVPVSLTTTHLTENTSTRTLNAQDGSMNLRATGSDAAADERPPSSALDWDMVHDLDRRIVDAIERNLDVREATAQLDPDPMRFMNTDEGDGELRDIVARGHRALDEAAPFPGHRSRESEALSPKGYCTNPFIAVGPNGLRLYVWVEWTGQGERLCAAMRERDGGQLGPHYVDEIVTDRVRPTALVDASGTPWIFDARRSTDGLHVYASRFRQHRWSPWTKVSTTAHPSFNQEAVSLSDGSVQVCWQGLRGSRFEIFGRRWRDGGWGETFCITNGRAGNVWDPSIAALPGGGLLVSWSEFDAGRYHVGLRALDREASPAAEAYRLPVDDGYALHPSVAAAPDGSIWCAFDLISVPEHGSSGPTHMKQRSEIGHRIDRSVPGKYVPPECLPRISSTVCVQRVVDGRAIESWHLARALDTVPGALPRIVVDSAGSPTVAYRARRRLPFLLYYWEAATQSWLGDSWSAPTTYGDSAGPLEEVAAACDGEDVYLAWHADARIDKALSWADGFGGQERVELAAHHGDVIWESVHDSGTIRATAASGRDNGAQGGAYRVTGLLARDSSQRSLPAHGSRVNTPSERYRTTVNGVEMELFWGDLHRHSLISRCTLGDEPSLDDYYRYSWDVCRYDFWAVTDHSENTSAHQWWSIQKIADLLHVPGEFVPFYGFEWTGRQGHHNVIYESGTRGAPIFSSRASGQQTPPELWRLLQADTQHPSITIPHHPGCAFVPFNWDYHDDTMVPLVEIFQACRGNYEDDDGFRRYSDATNRGQFALEGLRRGYRFGFIASSDHGYGAAYVGAYAAELARPAVFDALRSRRTFAATTRDLLVDVRLNGSFMGTEVASSGECAIEAYVRGYRDLAAVQLVRNGLVIAEERGRVELARGWIDVPVHIEWRGERFTTDWSGRLSIRDGGIAQSEYWPADVSWVERAAVEWSAVTKYFGSHYGGQRGGIDVTICGSPDATMRIDTAQGWAEIRLGDLQDRDVRIPTHVGSLVVGPGTGSLISLGSNEHRVHWTDVPTVPSWYYVRAIQVDGEIAWSSPIWATPSPRSNSRT